MENVSLSDPVEKKTIRARGILSGLGGVLVAFSGGVDSSVLLKLAIESLGKEKVLAVTAFGDLHPAQDKDRSSDIARLLGVRHIFCEDLSCRNQEFMRNTPQRCYHCKKILMNNLKVIAKENNLETIVAGENADDQLDYRPGHQALVELGIRCPLKEAHLTKKEVRLIAKGMGLPNYADPASPCLATRFPYGQHITTGLLKQIDQAESYLRELGFPVVRVRVHGQIARIEVREEDIYPMSEPAMRKRISEKFKDIGFTYTCVDLTGYEMGSLNKGANLPAAGK